MYLSDDKTGGRTDVVHREIALDELIHTENERKNLTEPKTHRKRPIFDTGGSKGGKKSAIAEHSNKRKRVADGSARNTGTVTHRICSEGGKRSQKTEIPCLVYKQTPGDKEALMVRT